MAKSKVKALPHFRSLDRLVQFFESHDMGNYWNEMPEANFEVNIKKRTHLISIDPRLSEKLTRIARSKRTSSEKLVNSWLRERIQQQG
ncbi:MAG: hypothetical protein A3H45_00235 [Ignavibacteria bacterium RIFCSPLOWO2_02_FULL_55_14]|nr:MAG: hypothetical protein A3H45_00235 [Ignavibacteria bacterium RIFCSPLOWO2_02_FULL_55_14]